MNQIEQLQKLIDNSHYIVFFGGAGVSTESGIKDFRSKDGLYNMKYKYNPETILSHHFFIHNTVEFYQFYQDKMNCLNAKSNICHHYLFKLEEKGKLLSIITQNIDGLHTKAGNQNVIELHGNIYQNYCTNCGKEFSAHDVFHSISIPICQCGGIIKPNVVLYEEPLEESTIYQAIDVLQKADLLLVVGTSLLVYPANSFLHYYKGKNIVIINNDKTNYDSLALLVIHDSIGNVFSKLK